MPFGRRVKVGHDIGAGYDLTEHSRSGTETFPDSKGFGVGHPTRYGRHGAPDKAYPYDRHSLGMYLLLSKVSKDQIKRT